MVQKIGARQNGLYYKKYTDVPFTGNVSGKTNSRFKFNYIENGGFKNGKNMVFGNPIVKTDNYMVKELTKMVNFTVFGHGIMTMVR